MNTIEFTDQELQIIVECLGEAPAKFSFPILKKIEEFKIKKATDGKDAE